MKPRNKKQGKDKTKKRKVSWMGIIALLVFIFFIILMSLPTDFFIKPKKRFVPGPLEPKFKTEGELSFYKRNTDQEIFKIDIEIADNNYERALGLMYRKSMADTLGMLFIMKYFEPQSFWMKNTFISLDIIYMDADFRIVKIQRNTEPRSTKSIPSYKKAKYVVEVVAGFCRKHKIRKGDYINYFRI